MELRTGNVLDYCGLSINFRKDGIVMIGVKEYIKEAIDQCLEEVKTYFKTPAARHLFEECEKLDEEKSKLFHSIKAAMLLEKNGVLPRGKRSRHVDIRFFFMKDRIEKGKVVHGGGLLN